jgi:hypothetical protein
MNGHTPFLSKILPEYSPGWMTTSRGLDILGLTVKKKQQTITEVEK